MRNKVLWFSAVLLVISGIAAAQPERGRAWVIDEGGLFLEEAGKPRRAIALPQWHWAHEPYACAPAIAIGPRDEAVVTSNVQPVLWKIDPQTLAVSMHRLELDADHDKDIGFSGLMYSERAGAYFAVSEHHGSLWRIDPLLRRAQKITLSQPLRGACSVSIEPQARVSRFSRLCVGGRSVNLAPDQRSAYVQARRCGSDALILTGGTR